MPAQTPEQLNRQEILGALRDLRTKLLDLTAHNPLLNYKHGRSSRYVRLVDELPDQVVSTLLAGKSMSFGPVPDPDDLEVEIWKKEKGRTKDPTPEEWARVCGIDSSSEAPRKTRRDAGRRHTDQVLQTLYFPNPLEARLGNMARLARTTVEETGTNMLHLVVGFLEWYEDDSSDSPRQAPLITIPVTLEKGRLQEDTRTYEYELRYSGEDCQDNASLAARLEQDFSYVLPELPEEISVEDYLGKVERSIQDKFPRWKVVRFMTLGFLNFGKLLMYRDLDPKSWPDSLKLEDNPLVGAIVSGSRQMESKGGGGGSVAFEEEFHIDEIADIHETFPIIDDADSSQHSALIDAVKGRNLVIEGPPGTGKSQTITNLIAAAMYAGKSVLFVSEKLAALEVVKQRLDRLGLGAYCLELHSHATQKSGVIESIKKRIQLSRRHSPAEYDDQIRRHRKLSETLGKHAGRMNSAWKDSGMTLHEILVGAARLSEELPEALKEVSDADTDTTGWSRQLQEDIVQEAKAFQSLVSKLVEELGGRPINRAHPWRGVGNLSLPMARHPQVVELLAKWNEELQAVSALWDEPRKVHGIDLPADRLETLRAIPAEVRALPGSPEWVAWHALTWASQGGHQALTELAREWEGILQTIAIAGTSCPLPELVGIDVKGSTMILRGLEASGFAGTTPLGEILDLFPEIEQSIAHAEAITGYFEEYAAAARGEIPDELKSESLSLAALRRVSGLLAHLRTAGQMAFGHRSESWIDAEVLDELRGISEELAALQAERKALSGAFVFGSLPNPSAIPELMSVLSDDGMIKRVFSPRYRRAKAETCVFLVEGKKEFDPKRVIALLGTLKQHLIEVERLQVKVQKGDRIAGDLWKGIETDRGLLDHLIDWHAGILKHHSSLSGNLFQQVRLDRFGSWVLTCHRDDLQNLMALDKVDFGGKCQQIFTTADRLEALAPRSGEVKVAGEGRVLGATKRLYEPGGNAGALQLMRALIIAAWNVSSVPGLGRGRTVSEGLSILPNIRDAQVKLASWLAKVHQLNSTTFAGSLHDTPGEAPTAAKIIGVTAAWGSHLAHAHHDSVVRRLLLKAPGAEMLAWLVNWVSVTEDRLKLADTARDSFEALAGIFPALWLDGIETLKGLIARNREAIEKPQMLPGYLRLLASSDTLRRFGLRKLARLVESNEHDPEQIAKACRHALLRGLSHAILDEHMDLQRFAGSRQEQVQQDFRELDREVLALTRKRVAAKVSGRLVPLGTRGARVKDHTEQELLVHEANKQRSHLPIRQLLRRAGEATKALKPCFMMGPRSVAQYLEPGGITFDLLVIDEASQMKPADAIGAAARVKQLVVVGDPKQLPPTSFFDRLGGDDEDEDQFAIGTSESILDAVLPVFPARRLRWHYRSKHQDLIAFSNRSFYDNHLLLFPSCGKDGGQQGLFFRSVEDGTFQNQVNQAEGMAVAKRVEELLCNDPGLSLGVATMSAKQRDHVEGCIEQLAKGNPAFNRALAKNCEQYEKLFIQNLESVQGHERSVMLISCTYGPSEVGGRVFQRFGPINSDLGWRRLNVLFTRSRERMELFSSMRSGDIMVGETSSRGVRAFRQFLHFAETKVLEAGEAMERPPDSDFEIAVAALLGEHGYECDFQVGVAGFFIDLAVKHPLRPSEYIMGVECDGATYHVGKSVRDRDRLRQEILESMHWRIRRIWSTDWFTNPRGALATILEELRSIAPLPHYSDGSE